MGQDNTLQRDAWNGEMGRSWSEFQDLLDNMMAPVTDKLLGAAKIGAGERVLDIGCGCGPTTIAAAKQAGPTGRVVGVDISGLLLKSARERARDLGSAIEFIEADASTHTFTERFDKIISRFGVMFFAEPTAAFANIRTALKPGGALTFICWRTPAENPWMTGLAQEAAKLVGFPQPQPQGYAPGPFGLGDRTFLQSVVEGAGFKGLTIEGFEPNLRIPGKTVDERVGFYSRIGAMASILREAPADKRRAVEDLIRRHAEKSFDPSQPPQSACWLVRAAN